MRSGPALESDFGHHPAAPRRRDRRPGLLFFGPAEFERKRQAGEFLEYAEVFGSGYWYGTLTAELERAAQARAWALLEIDVQGARRIVEQYPDAVTIFLTASPPREYEERLAAAARKAKPPFAAAWTSRDELAAAGFYRHQVINDDLEGGPRNRADSCFTGE